MTTTPRDKGQGFSGQGNAAKRVTPRKNGPPGGGMSDQGEAVVLDRWVDQDANAEKVLGKRQLGTDVATSYQDRRTGTRDDSPYTLPRDRMKNNTTPIVLDPVDPEFGRMAPELSRRVSWRDYAADPGRPGPLDPAPPDLNPKRPDWKAPSNEAYDISGKGEGEEVIGGQEGEYPDPDKKQNWA